MLSSGTAFIIFLVAYAGIAMGTIPGLAIDRTGIALLGAIAMVITGILTSNEAIQSIDISTILLLYGLMILSAQFRLGGFYTKIALAIVKNVKSPRWFLFILMLTSALLSALLANDIVCLAFTPVICVSIIEASLNPMPFLIGLACASNIGSASTIIGNPQNMLIGQIGSLDFGEFTLWCFPPAAISLAACYLIIIILYRGKWEEKKVGRTGGWKEWPAYNAHQSRKGVVLTAILITLLCTSIPREVTAVAIAGILLCSRKISTRSILSLVDWHLITLFCALFIIVAGIAKYQIPELMVSFLFSMGIDLNTPFTLSLATVALSNIVSNVPAVMLILKNINLAITENLYLLALVSTFAGNLITIGSIANLITIEQAKEYNVRIGFMEHARVGFPVTVVTIIIALLWNWFVR
jgi:Na+/H+ antiporter NhaD/arsenite permease-like protein